jgi:hypothetical protein
VKPSVPYSSQLFPFYFLREKLKHTLAAFHEIHFAEKQLKLDIKIPNRQNIITSLSFLKANGRICQYSKGAQIPGADSPG